MPEPHIRDDADERGYMGIFVPARDQVETQSLYVRFPVPLVHMMYEIVNDPREVYRGSTAAFMRHAVYEMLYQHLERRRGDRGNPEILGYMKQQQILRRRAFETFGREGQETALRSLEQFLTSAMDIGAAMDIHQHVLDIYSMIKESPNETWSLSLKSLVSKSAPIHRAVDFLVRKWQNSEDSWKREQATKWEQWWQSLED